MFLVFLLCPPLHGFPRRDTALYGNGVHASCFAPTFPSACAALNRQQSEPPTEVSPLIDDAVVCGPFFFPFFSLKQSHNIRYYEGRVASKLVQALQGNEAYSHKIPRVSHIDGAFFSCLKQKPFFCVVYYCMFWVLLGLKKGPFFATISLAHFVSFSG